MTKMTQYRDVASYPGHRLLFILTVGGAWGMAMAMYYVHVQEHVSISQTLPQHLWRIFPCH